MRAEQSTWVKPEIFALGIPNAIGLTVHPDTGEIWETENGPQGGDEVNIIRSGLNYGWPREPPAQHALTGIFHLWNI